MKFMRSSGIQKVNLVLFIILIVTVLSFLFGHIQKKHAYAQIDRIFASEQSNSMKKNLTRREVNDALHALEYVSAEDYEIENQRVHLIKEKYEAWNHLSQIYPLDETELHEVTSDLRFKEDVSDKNIENLYELSQWSHEDSETDQLGELVEQAQKDWEVIKKARQQLEQLDSSVVDSETLATLCELGKELGQQVDHPQIQELERDIKDKADEMLLQAETAYVEGAVDREDLFPLLSWDYTSEQIIDGPMDVRKVASLTFDDGPDPHFTPLYLDLLNKYNVKGTFFLLGQAAETYPEIVERMINEGHEVGNHSYSHPDFAGLSDEGILYEISLTNEVISNITGQEVGVYRMPYGSGGLRVTQLLPHMHSIMWNVDSEDWLTQNEEAIYQKVMAGAHDGAVILMHDRFDEGLAALERIIVSLLDEGYYFVPASENLLSFDYY